jgi:hypothetical protein
MARALPTCLLAAPTVAGVELMRIIPDRKPGYLDMLGAVKRYLAGDRLQHDVALFFTSFGFSLSQTPTGKASTG